jgi:hypothetical protein
MACYLYLAIDASKKLDRPILPPDSAIPSQVQQRTGAI